MPYKNPKDRNYKKEYANQKKRGEHKARMARQRARRAIDKRDTGTVTKKSPKRVGKDVSHNSSLAKAKNPDKVGYKIEARSKNRKRNYRSKS